MRRRNTELGLLVLVVAITAGAYVLASLGRDSTMPVDIVPFLLVICGLLLAGNLLTRRIAPQADPILLPLAGLLNGIGYVTIARIDEDLAGLQATWTLVAIGAFAVTLVLVRRSRDLANYRWTIGLVGLALILLPLTPLGREINGARIWVQLGPMNVQPGEFAKLALACFFAGYLVEKRELLAMGSWGVGRLRIPDPKHLAPVMVAWGLSLLVMAYQTDMGSALLFFALFVVMLWVATQRSSYLVLSATLFVAGAWFGHERFGHVRVRVRTWLDPWSDVQGEGFQVTQAAFAMADGGVTGTGLGRSGSIAVPFAETDFIFAVIAQELGLLGSTVVLSTFVLVIGAGLRIALQSRDAFDKLLATGLTAFLGIQTFVIIAGVTRLLPLTGITLPFVSYGGSSLVSNYVLIALLLRISDDTNRRRLHGPRAQTTDDDDGAATLGAPR